MENLRIVKKNFFQRLIHLMMFITVTLKWNQARLTIIGYSKLKSPTTSKQESLVYYTSPLKFLI
jgi:hypothetical protein